MFKDSIQIDEDKIDEYVSAAKDASLYTGYFERLLYFRLDAFSSALNCFGPSSKSDLINFV
jgi:hypothetical protein